MKKFPKWIVFASILSCSDGAERPETVTKLRMFGVQSNPTIITPQTDASQLVELTAFAMVPKGQNAEIEAWDEDNVRVLDLNFNGKQVTERAGFDILEFSLQSPPPIMGIIKVPESTGFLALPYSFRIFNDTEEEKVVGRVVIFDQDSPFTNFQNPSISIESPTADQDVSGSVSLKATLTGTGEEEFKIGWYVSSGEVLLRRSLDTEWEDIADGGQTVLVTARGKKSGTFVYAVVDVN